VTEETIAWAYSVTEQTNDGGYFPVGANLAWHGGLHFPSVDPTATVHALFPGTVVAARLGPPGGATRYLRGDYVEAVPATEAAAPRVRAGDVIAPMGVFGRRGILHPDDGDPIIHVEVFSADTSSLYALLDAARDRAHRTSSAPAGDGAPRGGTPAFEWAEAVGGDAVQATKEIARILREPTTSTRAAKVDRIRGPDAVTYAGRDILAATFWQRAGELTPDEVQWFFAHHPNAVRLRAYACRFVGEWVEMPGVFNMMSNGDAEALAWWKTVAEAIDDLPADGHTWTYNPIRILQLVMSTLGAEIA